MNIWQTLPKPFFVLAPMDDVTDTVFRRIVAGCAAPDLYFTEFVNVDGLQSPGRPKLLKKLQFTRGEKPIIAQIWGKRPENYYQTAKELVGMGFDGIDINMGCPDKTIVKNGCCAALINNRELAGEIIAATREAVGDHFPISVKTRLGYDKIDLGWPEYLLKQKLNVLSIHARTVKNMSDVPADWAKIGQIAQIRNDVSPTTLLVGNGDVLSRLQGEQLAKHYGVEGIMIGRGVFHDPYVFAPNSPWLGMDRQERLNLYRRHIELFALVWQDSERRVHTLNKFCKIYVNGFDGAKELREQLMRAQTIPELLNTLESQKETNSQLIAR